VDRKLIDKTVEAAKEVPCFVSGVLPEFSSPAAEKMKFSG